MRCHVIIVSTDYLHLQYKRTSTKVYPACFSYLYLKYFHVKLAQHLHLDVLRCDSLCFVLSHILVALFTADFYI